MAAAVVAVSGSAGGLWAQADGGGVAAEALEPQPGLEAVDRSRGVVSGELAFAASRVWVWGGDEGSTRLFLDGDASLRAGDVAFEAARAAVWLEPDGATGATRVFIYAESVRTPGALSGSSISAARLPIAALVRAPGGVRIDAGALIRTAPPPGLGAALDRAQAERERVLSGRGPEAAPRVEPGPFRPADAGGAVREVGPGLEAGLEAGLGPTEPAGAAGGAGPVGIFSGRGVFYFSTEGEVTLSRGESANTAVLTGGVVVQYEGEEGALELVSRRAVVFFRPGPLAQTLSSLTAEDVYGVYLEGGVRATDGSYTLRGEQMYYDVRTGRALALDAVFWTFDADAGLPLYLRAQAVRQEAADQFSARGATVANSAFFRPHLSLGVREVTVKLEPRERSPGVLGDRRAIVDARGITARAGSLPFFAWPRFVGDPERVAIRGATVSNSNRTGPEIQTAWDPFALLGVRRPEGLRARLDVDFFEQRGFGVGVQSDWERGGHVGDLLAYTIPTDNGSDLSVSGEEVKRDGDFRGLLIFRDRWKIRDEWTAIAELASISDPLLTQDIFADIGRDGPDAQTRAHLARRDGSSVLTFELRGEVNDFIPNQHRLQSPGYLVDKLPEIRLEVPADDVLDFVLPGLLTHTWSAGYSHTRLRFSEVTGASQGFTGDLSEAVFGIPETATLGDAFRALGLDESFVNRFDTRQELTLDLGLGPLSVTPFVVGRATVYDTDFGEFSPEENDSTRLWGAAGLRLATSIQRVYNGASSRTFDINRVRHIIEPQLTLWHAQTTVDASDLPIIDDDVEQLGRGNAARLVVDQTFQTKRGGPGRWRTVDLLKVRAEYDWAADRAGRGTPIGRFFDARPENGSPDTFFAGSFVLQASEITALTGEVNYDPGISQIARSSIGAVLTPGRGFDARVGYRQINPTGSSFVEGGLGYFFADKYRVDLDTQYDVEFEDFRGVGVRVLRDFPAARFGFSFRFDNITGETSFGFIISPIGGGPPGALPFFGLGSGLGGERRGARFGS